MGEKKRIVYWDSNAFLGLINGEPDKLQECTDAWQEAQEGSIVIVTSTLTLAEVIWMKGIPKLDPKNRTTVANFFRAKWITQRPVTRAIAEFARDVVWDNAIHPKDAVHIATSAMEKIAEFHTFDGDLIKKSPVMVKGFGVTITRPKGSGQTRLSLGP